MNNDEGLRAVREVIDSGPFDDTWESLANYRPPLWYQDAKFGIFIHWGVFSVPEFGSEWYSREMYRAGTREYEHHLSTYGPQKDFGYKDFIPQFTMSSFNPHDWAALFRTAGAQFVVPVAEHHDGFAMYDSERTRWKASEMGPGRDVFGQLAEAVTGAWMVIGASSHRAEHWFFMNGGARFESDVLDPEFADFYGPAQREETAPNEQFIEDWLLRTVEVIDRYRPQLLWFDWWLEQPAFEPYVRMLAAYYYNRASQWGRGVVINYKYGAFRQGTAVYDIERGAMAGIRPAIWQNDTSLSRNSWSYARDNDYKTAADLIAELADVVAKNGVLLLNVGPKSDGTIADEEQALLREIGSWLSICGEALYGSRPWLIPAEGPTQAVSGSFVDLPTYTAADIRFTTRTDVTGDYVYAILLRRPEDGIARIRSFGTASGLLTRDIQEVSELGSSALSEWERDRDEMRVVLSADVGVGAVIKLFLNAERPEPRHEFLHQ